MLDSSAGSGPSSAASGIPWTLPLSDVAGVFMSPCASIHSRPIGRSFVCLRPVRPPPRPSRRRGCDRRRARAAVAPACKRLERRLVQLLADLRDVADVLLAARRAAPVFPESAPADRPVDDGETERGRGARRARRCETPTAPCRRRAAAAEVERNADDVDGTHCGRAVTYELAISPCMRPTSLRCPGATIVVNRAGSFWIAARKSRISVCLLTTLCARNRPRGRSRGNARSKNRL